MRVFIAGATGVIGRRLVPMLVAEGHDVTGMSRSAERAEGVKALGAEAVVCDAFDADGVTAAVTAAKPDVLIHQLTQIPKAIDWRRYEEQMAGNDRVRIEGTHNLVSAAKAAGARRVIAQSIAFAYAPTGPRILTEDAPLFLDAPSFFHRSVAALAELERTVTETEGIEGVVLRYGYFYGPGTAYGHGGSTYDQVEKRKFPIPGRGEGLFSLIHIDDAAAATVAALDHGAPGIYNVVDDEPAALREWLPVYAEAIGAPKPRRVPRWIAALAIGKGPVSFVEELRGASNDKAKRQLGWKPAHPSWRDGFRDPETRG